MEQTYLVTGGMGCIGAWALRHLVQQGKEAVNFDLSDDRHRLDWLMDADEQAAVTFVQGDLADPRQVRSVIDDHAITRIIHLGALQVPMCRDNPVLGAQVNVTGTINIFEAALAAGISHLTYASSIAVYGPAHAYPESPLPNDAERSPTTLYGAFKVCNEDTAAVYFADHRITSTALRPYTVYGVGRDQGLTSEPTKAMAAAARGDDCHIGFGGRMQFQHASDVARQFIDASEQPLGGAFVFNLGTPATAVHDLADLIMECEPDVTITVSEETRLPFPESFDSSELHMHFDTVYETPLAEGIAATIGAMANLDL